MNFMRELEKKLVEYKHDNCTHHKWHTWKSPKKTWKKVKSG